SHLTERQHAIEAELERLASRPAELAAERGRMLEAIGEKESLRRAAADKLAEAEAKLAEADRALKQAERELGEAREGRIRFEAAVTQADEQVKHMAAQIRERLECQPEEVLALAELREGQEPLAEDELVGKLDRLTRERDAIGPVNLRAEQE